MGRKRKKRRKIKNVRGRRRGRSKKRRRRGPAAWRRHLGIPFDPQLAMSKLATFLSELDDDVHEMDGCLSAEFLHGLGMPSGVAIDEHLHTLTGRIAPLGLGVLPPARADLVERRVDALFERGRKAGWAYAYLLDATPGLWRVVRDSADGNGTEALRLELCSGEATCSPADVLRLGGARPEPAELPDGAYVFGYAGPRRYAFTTIEILETEAVRRLEDAILEDALRYGEYRDPLVLHVTHALTMVSADRYLVQHPGTEDSLAEILAADVPFPAVLQLAFHNTSLQPILDVIEVRKARMDRRLLAHADVLDTELDYAPSDPEVTVYDMRGGKRRSWRCVAAQAETAEDMRPLVVAARVAMRRRFGRMYEQDASGTFVDEAAYSIDELFRCLGMSTDGAVVGAPDEHLRACEVRALRLADDHPLFASVHRTAPISAALRWTEQPSARRAEEVLAVWRRLRAERRFLALMLHGFSSVERFLELNPQWGFDELCEGVRGVFDPRFGTLDVELLARKRGAVARLHKALDQLGVESRAIRDLPSSSMLLAARGFGEGSLRQLGLALYEEMDGWRGGLVLAASDDDGEAMRETMREAGDGLDALMAMFGD